MMINQPIGFTEKGRRKHNEDYIYPTRQTVGTSDCLFMVCDGEGGEMNGRLVSKMLCEQLAESLSDIHYFEEISNRIQDVLNHTQVQLDAYVEEYPDTEEMASTLGLVYIFDQQVIVAHIGDSRVYLIRDGQITWKTEDHSYTQELIKRGKLTEEEALDHPQKNVLIKAVQAGGSFPVIADVHQIKGIQAGDVFFLCTDGVWDTIPDQQLAAIFGSATSFSDKMNVLQSICSRSSTDNYSAYLIPIASENRQILEGYEQPLQAAPLEIISLAYLENERSAESGEEDWPTVYKKTEESTNRKFHKTAPLLSQGLIVLPFIVLFALFLLVYSLAPNNKKAPEKQSVIKSRKTESLTVPVDTFEVQDSTLTP